MFIVFFLFLGFVYLVWQYKTAAYKKIFLKSALIQSLLWCSGMIIISMVIVNMFMHKKPDKQDFAFVEPKDSLLDTLKNDLSFDQLKRHFNDPGYHYRYIEKYFTLPVSWTVQHETVYRDQDALLSWYKKLKKSQNEDTLLIGKFGNGVMNIFNRKYEEAIDLLSSISASGRPYLHYATGMAYWSNHDVDQAIYHFSEEMKIDNGNLDGALLKLSDIYVERNDLKSLYPLLHNPLVIKKVDGRIVRSAYLFNLDLYHYLLWFKAYYRKSVSLYGLIAALAILMIWLVYLITLDLFQKERFPYILICLLLGMASPNIVFFINDVLGFWIHPHVNGQLIHDLVYTIFGIGMPEELAKFLPVLVMLVFTREVDEPIDYLLYASLSALGFAFIENILYFQEFHGGIIHARALTAVVGHMIYASIVVYGFVRIRYQKLKRNSILVFIQYFMLVSLAHGVYDFLLFWHLNIVFILFFIFMVQIWIVMLNNAMNNSEYFSYKIGPISEKLRFYLALGLTFIVMLEYFVVGMKSGHHQANSQLVSSFFSGGMLIVFFASNLSTFDLVKGYWRSIYLSNRQRKDYKKCGSIINLLSFFLVNNILAHNYVNHQISIFSEPSNINLYDLLPKPIKGEIVDRKIMFRFDEESESWYNDPNWFVVKLECAIIFEEKQQRYVLIKPQNVNMSLYHERDAQVFFCFVPMVNKLKSSNVHQEDTVAYGQAIVNPDPDWLGTKKLI